MRRYTVLCRWDDRSQSDFDISRLDIDPSGDTAAEWIVADGNPAAAALPPQHYAGRATIAARLNEWRDARRFINADRSPGAPRAVIVREDLP